MAISRPATIVDFGSISVLQISHRNLDGGATISAVSPSSDYGYIRTALGAPPGGATGNPRPPSGWLWPRG